MADRYLIRYEKTGPMRYIGHLDFTDAFRRAVKRSGLPAEYSAGYNPRVKLSFALPLPVGYAGLSEYAEIFLKEPAGAQEIIKPLNETLPEGVHILETRTLNENEKGPASALLAAKYSIVLDGPRDIGHYLEILLSGKESDETAKLLISAETAGENEIIIMAPHGNNKNLKPDSVAARLHEIIGTEYDPVKTKFTRLEMYKNKNGSLAPIFEL